VSAYLSKHGILNRGIWEAYRLGFVSSPLKGDERFTGMLAIPYLTPAGVKALKFRRLVGRGPKYGQHEGQKPRLFNVLAFANATDQIGICEGEIDAIAATEGLHIPAMGVPGVDHWQANAETWAPVFKDFGRVLVFADGDTPRCQCSPRCKLDCPNPVRPGEVLARRVAQTVGWRAQIIYAPEGEDVASLVAAGRGDVLTNQIRDFSDD